LFGPRRRTHAPYPARTSRSTTPPGTSSPPPPSYGMSPVGEESSRRSQRDCFTRRRQVAVALARGEIGLVQHTGRRSGGLPGMPVPALIAQFGS